jgi:hypothetical protein
MRISAAGSVALLAVLATASACHRQPPLPAELAAIHCPVNRAEHAKATFGKAALTFVCISEELADSPYLLRCDLDSRPMVCEDAGSLMFSRGKDGKVYAGPGPKSFAQPGSSAAGSDLSSRLIVNFHGGPPRTPTFDEVETDWRFLVPDSSQLLPPGFTFVKGALCDREATVLHTGSCNLEARTPSLYWHISVYIPADKGTPISEEEYRFELQFWLRILGQMVADPGK